MTASLLLIIKRDTLAAVNNTMQGMLTIKKIAFLLIGSALFSYEFCAAGERLEAENAVLTGVNTATSHAGFSGTGYVTGFDADGDKVAFHFDAAGGIYDLFIGFCTPNGEKGYDLAVNGSNSTGMFPASNSFSEVSAGKVLLVEGGNDIVVGNGWGWYYLDYIRLAPAETYRPDKPQQGLSDDQATVDAKDLYEFLEGLYAEKILSGQHGLSDLQYIKTTTGHTPVVAGFDLIEYSPSRIEHGSNPTGSVESWIAWEKEQGCIINLLWHWNAPADLINTTGKEWWRGFYTDATTFNIAEVLSDTLSERYSLLIRDMDSIASQLKKFMDKDIPVLWRPLHEASGGWFWWGAQGPGPFIELWRLLYNRMVNVHQLHNLIWVYTSGDAEWYPGDEYVDIASLDIYSSTGSSMSADWENAQAVYNGRKMVALSESGTLPVPEKIRLFNTWWSWFSLWTGDFIRGADKEELTALYNDRDILTMEKMGDWRTYSSWKEYGSLSSPGNEMAVFYDPEKHIVRLAYDYDYNGAGPHTLRIYTMQGHLMEQQPFIPSPAGTVYAEITSLPAGIYIAVIGSSSTSSTGKFMVPE
jgi:mannan endo-1,4-beta-mannosidase